MPRLLFRSASILTLVVPILAAKAQFADDFSDNDFTTGVVWSGDNGLFTAATGALQSQSPGAANYYLSTPSTQSASAQWEFFVNLKFSTSGANYADVYLMSSAADLASGVNGYYVRIGGTQDRVELFRSDVGTGTSMIASPDGIVNSSSDNPFLLRVKRDAADLWTLEYDDGALGTYTLAGSNTDATYSASTHFGVRIEQSTAVSPINNHFFDDFSVGPIPVDLTPPVLLSATALDATHVLLTFNEALLGSSVTATANYAFTCSVGASVATLSTATTIELTLASALPEDVSCTVTVNNVADLAGNTVSDAQATFLFAVPDVALPGDVIITEIMADPTPAVGLPEAEFIEVHNTTADRTFDLLNWTISDGSTTGSLPSVALGPGAYAILTDDANASLFNGMGTVVPIASFPSLNNDGDPLELVSNTVVTIDAVSYELSWYNDAVKAFGGWTLERIDPTTPCSGPANWTASMAPTGGTPGEQNSVYAIITDTQAPSLTGVLVNSGTVIQLVFSEAMDVATLAGGTYTLQPAIAVAQVQVIDASTVQLTLAEALTVGTLYTITVSGVSDCPGNTIGTSNTLALALPEAVSVGDVVINEVLYDPISTGSDFVELYNKSDKVLSLANWKLANETNGVIGSPVTITSSSVLLLPGEYVVITEDVANIASIYPLGHTERYVEADMPSYNNGNGTVVLQAPDNSTLDLFRYDDALHFPLLGETEGVSLERVSPARASNDNTNWHSAAQTVGFATPGYQNSCYSGSIDLSGELTIDPAIFSPDNDGYQDLLHINYRFDAPGYTGTVKVFDLAGREMITLLNNELLGTTGQISWNGVMESGGLARMGPYVVVLEAFEPGGDVQRFRETVVLAHKVN